MVLNWARGKAFSMLKFYKYGGRGREREKEGGKEGEKEKRTTDVLKHRQT